MAHFDQALNITGSILTKLDGDARGGAALSLKSVTGKPIKFAGVGEKLDEFEPFHPERMASRILGMGDVVSLVEKAAEVVSEDEAKRMEEKMRKGQFTLEDFLDQLRQMKKLGSLESIVGMLPGGADMLKGADLEVRAGEVVAVMGGLVPIVTVASSATVGGASMPPLAFQPGDVFQLRLDLAVGLRDARDEHRAIHDPNEHRTTSY